MAPSPWASEAQLQFLKDKRGEYQTYQKAKNLPSFWVKVMRDWFARWPEISSMSTEPGGEDKDSADDGSATTRKVCFIVSAVPLYINH